MKTTSKKAAKSSTMSHAKRSEIARKAAKSAWTFMRSKPYQRIVNSNLTDAKKRAAIEVLKQKRAA